MTITTTRRQPKTAFPSGLTLGSGTDVLGRFEFGALTPTVTFATVGDWSPTYSVQTGQFSIIGRTCFFELSVTLTANAYSTASGALRVLFGGAPAAHTNGGIFFYPVAGSFENLTFDESKILTPSVVSGQSYIQLVLSTSNASRASINTAGIPASKAGVIITLSGHYEIA